MGEFTYIAKVRQRLARDLPAQSRLVLGIGDDAAITGPYPDGCLFAADMLMDGVHFDLKNTTAALAGRKALAVNLSDIAAMAGTPDAVTVSVALPRRASAQIADGVLDGIAALAREFDVAVAGGDTNTWDGPLVIAVSILGKPHPKGSVTRSGARPGDWVLVSGYLGGSISGHHLTFTPRVREAQQIHSRWNIHAMIDLSDGLASDLRHILESSGVGCRLDPHAIPVNPRLTRDRALLLNQALCDGEDFELCLTMSPQDGAALLSEQPFAPALRLTHIGTVTTETGRMSSTDGHDISVRGYAHTFEGDDP